MNDFIQWCNDNQGFLTFILSALTILISIIAIVVSIKTATLPYKKKVLIKATITHTSSSGISELTNMSILVRNLSSVPIVIKEIYLGYKNKFKLVKTEDQLYKVKNDNVISQMSWVNYTLNLDDIKSLLENISPNKKIYLIIKDNDGKVFTDKLPYFPVRETI